MNNKYYNKEDSPRSEKITRVAVLCVYAFFFGMLLYMILHKIIDN